MSQPRNRRKEPPPPEFVAGVELTDIAYGGETVGHLPPGYILPNERGKPENPPPDTESISPFPQEEEDAGDEYLPSPVATHRFDAPEAAREGLGVRVIQPGPVIFVAGGVPGERVTVRLFRRQKSFWRGTVTEIERAAAERTTPPCPYFGVEKWPNCGGCQWQHTDYAAQVTFKDKILRDQLERIGGLTAPPMRDPVAALNPWRYRNNAEFQIDRATGRPCFHRQNSIRLVPIESCDIVHPLIQASIEPMAEALARHLPGKVHQVTVRVGNINNPDPAAPPNLLHTPILFVLRLLGEVGMALDDFGRELDAALRAAGATAVSVIGEGKKRRLRVVAGPGDLTEYLNGLRFTVPPLAFFQSNAVMAQQLVARALNTLAATGVLTPGAVLLDLFCGVGTFSLALAARGATVLGVEEFAGATAAAEVNAGLNPDLAGSARFVAARAEEFIVELAEGRADATYTPFTKPAAVLLDPPRRGCEPPLIAALLALHAPYLLYVSCDPSTLARDIRALGDGYELVSAQVVDMFPQTYHLETIALLKAKVGA